MTPRSSLNEIHNFGTKGMGVHFLIPVIVGVLILGTLGLTPIDSFAEVIPIFSTGVDDSGNPLPLGSVDPHFVVVENGDSPAVVLDRQCGCWVNDSANSLWVWVTSDSSQNVNAIFTFKTTFDLTGFDPSTARIDGRVAVDNALDGIKLNGVSLPNPGGGFSSFRPFTITSGFQPGINTLEFIARDFGVIAGFNVQLSGEAAGSDLVLVSAQPIQAVEGTSAFVLDKLTVFKAVIKNTFPEDKTFLVTLFLDDTALVSIDEVLVKAGCTATYYFPSPRDPTACDDKPLTASRNYEPSSTVIGEGMLNFKITIDSGNQVEENDEDNNELVSIHQWTKTKDLVILNVPIKHSFSDMITPCPPEERELSVFCSPDPARILTPIQWVDLVYPVDNIQSIQLPPYYNANLSDDEDDIPGLWDDLDLMRKNWITSNPGADREVVLYGWLPTDTLQQGWGWSVPKTGFGDENIDSIGNCANCGDMHVNDILLAHEIGHMLKVKHPTDENKEPECTGFNAPFTSITINQQGYHIPTGHIKDPTINEHMMGGHCLDLGVTLSEEKWTSPEGWDNLIQLMGGTVGPLAVTPLVALSENIVISGIISNEGNSGQLDPLYKSMFIVDVTDGPFTLEILDSENNILHTQNFAISEPDHIKAGKDAVNLSFFLVTPFPEGIDSIQILNGAIVLDSVQVSPNTPSVSVLFPNGGETLSGLQTITWDGSDADGDDLFYKVEYSFDEGTIWNLIAKDFSTTSQAVNFDQLPGNGNTALIRVTVTDGVNTNSDTSDALFSVVNKPPLVVIIRPQTDIEINSVDGVSLQGEAADIEDGVPPPDSSFSWSSSIDGILGSGRILNPGILTAGVHLVTLTVTDSDGLQGSSTIKLFIDVMPVEIINGFSAKGQRSDVNEFLTYDNPRETSISLASGTTSFDLRLLYGETVLPNTFSAVLNNVDVTSNFHPFEGLGEQVTIDLQEGRNVLKLTIDGVRTDGHTATERDRLVFKVG